MTKFAEDVSGMLSPAEIGSMSGLDFMRGVMEGRLPAAPIAKTLNYSLIELEEGRAVFAGTPGFESYNPIGSVHGGWFGTLLDSCMACAVQTTLPAGKGYTTLEYKVNILRAATVNTGLIRAEGTVIHSGRRTATAEGRMVDEAGKVYATGTTPCLILDLA